MRQLDAIVLPLQGSESMAKPVNDTRRKAASQRGGAMASHDQVERFKQAARELGTDDDPEHFKQVVRRIAKAKSSADEGRGGKTAKRDGS